MLSDQKRTEFIKEMAIMLTYCRAPNGKGELEFIEKFIMPLGAKPDKYGNYIKVVGKNPKVMYSCHTDTVHKTSGRQHVEINDKGMISRESYKGGGCLGADDGGGVWMLMNMIKENIPGLYIFHREEENGGNGSLYISEETPEIVKNINIAIAFDRKGTGDIITHQFGDRCCSDAFADSLGEQLKGYTKDTTGSFTDTARYTGLVEECTNLSIGYSSAHTTREDLDANHLLDLFEQILVLDTSKLVVSRSLLPLADDDYLHYKKSYNYWDGKPYINNTTKDKKKGSQNSAVEVYSGKKKRKKTESSQSYNHQGQAIPNGNKVRYGDLPDGGVDNDEDISDQALIESYDEEQLRELIEDSIIDHPYGSMAKLMMDEDEEQYPYTDDFPEQLYMDGLIDSEMLFKLQRQRNFDDLDYTGPEHKKSSEVPIYADEFKTPLTKEEYKKRITLIQKAARKLMLQKRST